MKKNDICLQAQDAWNFCRMDVFWQCFELLSPWAKDEHERREVYCDRDLIEKRLDDIELASAFLARHAADAISLDRVSFHLKRMPRFPLDVKSEYEQLELFQIKKFLANYRGLCSRLDDTVIQAFGLLTLCPDLAAALDKGGSDAETFYLADSYHPELGEVRGRLRHLDQALAVLRERQCAAAKAALGLHFEDRDFLIVPQTQLNQPAALAHHYSIEPYDDASYLVRLVPLPEAIKLASEREHWLERERQLESLVLRELSLLAAAAMPALTAAMAAVRRWDRARAGALLAERFCLVRPQLDMSGAVELEDGRYLPCIFDCEKLGLHYEPLDAKLDTAAVVLFGSNMGGKTVVLQSLLFFQLLAQGGWYVPAACFRTAIFRHIEYVGELAGERLAGLSGFGFEIWRLKRVWGLPNALIAFDELARTTGSHEAEALLSAVVAASAQAPARPALSLFSTHFRGVARLPGVLYLRMQGLDRPAACPDTQAADTDLQASLLDINRHMRYRLLPDNPDLDQGSDALAIAAMLGLDAAIVNQACLFLAHGDLGVDRAAGDRTGGT